MEVMMADSEIRIRTFKVEDYLELVSVWSASGSGFAPRGRESPEAYRVHVERFPNLSFAAVADGAIIGVVLGSHDGRKGWISRLAVRPEYRRRGVAGTLVSACDSAIRAAGISIVAALVEEQNVASAAVFRSLGYSDAVAVHYFRKLSHPDA